MHTSAFTYGAFDNFISKVLLLSASEMAIVTNSVRVAKLTVAVMLCACPVLSVCMADLEFAQGVFVSRACAHTCMFIHNYMSMCNEKLRRNSVKHRKKARQLINFIPIYVCMYVYVRNCNLSIV